MGRSRGWEAGGRNAPSKSQVAIVFLKHSGSEPPLEAFGPMKHLNPLARRRSIRPSVKYVKKKKKKKKKKRKKKKKKKGPPICS